MKALWEDCFSSLSSFLCCLCSSLSTSLFSWISSGIPEEIEHRMLESLLLWSLASLTPFLLLFCFCFFFFASNVLSLLNLHEEFLVFLHLETTVGSEWKKKQDPLRFVRNQHSRQMLSSICIPSATDKCSSIRVTQSSMEEVSVVKFVDCLHSLKLRLHCRWDT